MRWQIELSTNASRATAVGLNVELEADYYIAAEGILRFYVFKQIGSQTIEDTKSGIFVKGFSIYNIISFTPIPKTI